MKTFTSARTLALLTATLALGAFSAIALAGPGPQYWNKTPAAAPTAPATPKCLGCTSTTTKPFASTDRGPAGKGAHDAAVVKTTHGCSICTGTIETAKGQTKDTMTRAAACGTMMCCK